PHVSIVPHSQTPFWPAPTHYRHSERSLRSEIRFSIARLLCDESLFAGCPRDGVCAWALGSSSLLSSLIDWLSSRLRPQEGAQRPHFLFRAALWHVGPRSAFCAPRALRRGGGICFFLPSLRTSASSAPLRYLYSCFLMTAI